MEDRIILVSFRHSLDLLTPLYPSIPLLISPLFLIVHRGVRVVSKEDFPNSAIYGGGRHSLRTVVDARDVNLLKYLEEASANTIRDCASSLVCSEHSSCLTLSV